MFQRAVFYKCSQNLYSETHTPSRSHKREAMRLYAFVPLLLLLFSSTKPVKLWRLKDNSIDKAKGQYPIMILFHGEEDDEDEGRAYLNALNESLPGLDIFSISAAEVNCAQNHRACKTNGVKTQPVLKFFSKKASIEYTGRANGSEIHQWAINIQGNGLRVFRTEEDAKLVMKGLDTVFLGRFESRKGIEFKVFEEAAANPKEGCLFIAVVNPSIETDEIQFIRLKDNWTETYDGDWDWGRLSVWMNEVQAPWSEELYSEGAERFFKRQIPLAIFFYDRRPGMSLFSSSFSSHSSNSRGTEEGRKEEHFCQRYNCTALEADEEKKRIDDLKRAPTRDDDRTRVDEEAQEIAASLAHEKSNISKDTVNTRQTFGLPLSSSSSSSSSHHPPAFHERNFILSVANAIGRRYRHRVVPITASHRRHWRYAETLGVSAQQVPGFVLVAPFPSYDERAKAAYPLWVEEEEGGKKEGGETGTDGARFVEEWERLGSSVALEHVARHIDSFFAGILPLALRSEAPRSKEEEFKYPFALDYSLFTCPAANTSLPVYSVPHSPVKRVSGREFNATVFGLEDVLLFLYTPWCAKCPAAAAAFEALAKEYEEWHSAALRTGTQPAHRVVFASLDRTQNDIWPYFRADSFPGLLLFRTSDPLHPLACEDCITVDRLKKFLHSSLPSFPLPEDKEGLKQEEKRERKRKWLMQALGLDKKIPRPKLLYENDI